MSVSQDVTSFLEDASGFKGTAERAAAILSEAKIAAVGPVQHPAGSPIAASLYFRDPCGNFIELCSGAK